MKLLLTFFLLLVVVLVSSAAAVPSEFVQREPLIVHTKQRQWLADDLKAYHRQMRIVHKNYIPSYPAAPVLTTISVGYPAVNFTVSMESGSEAIFVLAKDYPARAANQSFYDPAQSSSAQYLGDYQGFSGNLEAFGAAYYDLVGFPGFDVSDGIGQRFGVVNKVEDPYKFDPQMPDGVLGMSWDPKDAANPSENSSAVVNLFAYKLKGKRFYCQWLESDTNPQYGREYTGLTSFGACLDAICQAPTDENTHPLMWLDDTRSLAFTVDSFAYNEQQFSGGFGKVDTGMPMMLVPYDPLLAIYKDVQPDYDYDHFIYTVDCNRAGTLPDWTFTIGGSNYTIPSSDYVVDLLLLDDQCALSVLHWDYETPDYVFGSVFSSHRCLKMDIDNQAISFMDVLPQ